VSGAHEANAAVIWTKFPEGMGTVIMDFDAPGVKMGEGFTNMFGHTQSQFYMDEVRIPAENVLTRGPEGFKNQLIALNWERIGSAAIANGAALCAFDKALAYAKTREQFGQPIGEFQGLRWKLTDMAKKIQASRMLVFQAADAAKGGSTPSRRDSSIANLYSAEILEQVVSEALQIHGANGYQKGHPLEYLYRFARSRRIAGGTDEIQKNTIADALFEEGLPSLG
jgi:alkylation response protein AidB-like acyl-CoA dehydrogenase